MAPSRTHRRQSLPADPPALHELTAVERDVITLLNPDALEAVGVRDCRWVSQ